MVAKKRKVELTVIVPVYNEEKTVKMVLRKLLELKYIKEIIVVDDRSTDNTPQILQTFSKHLQIITHKSNRGKGTAIRSGAKRVTTSHFIIQDADLEVDPTDIKLLWEKIKSKKAKVVFGSRFYYGKGKDNWWHYFGNLLLTKITNFLFNVQMTDMETCYKLLPITLFNSLNLRAYHFEFEPEITAKIIKCGVRILEVPINYRPRSYTEGKKINIWDAVEAVKVLLHHRFIDVNSKRTP